jgi:hypothetical protein
LSWILLALLVTATGLAQVEALQRTAAACGWALRP